MLATFFLMGAEAISLYLKFVVVLGIPEFLDNRYVLKGTLISWSKYTINNGFVTIHFSLKLIFIAEVSTGISDM